MRGGATHPLTKPLELPTACNLQVHLVPAGILEEEGEGGGRGRRKREEGEGGGRGRRKREEGE